MRRAGCSATDGFTLLEVVVVLAVLGVLYAVAVGSFEGSAWGREDGTMPPGQAELADTLRRATREGRAIRLSVVVDGQATTVTAFPGGRLVGGESVGADPLTGAWER